MTLIATQRKLARHYATKRHLDSKTIEDKRALISLFFFFFFKIIFISETQDSDSNEDGNYKAEVEFTLKGEKTTIPLPDLIFKITANTIYTKEEVISQETSGKNDDSDTQETLENNDNPDGDNLKPGVIAGIAIGCFLIVILICFCVYWFVFREKPNKIKTEL